MRCRFRPRSTRRATVTRTARPSWTTWRSCPSSARSLVLVRSSCATSSRWNRAPHKISGAGKRGCGRAGTTRPATQPKVRPAKARKFTTCAAAWAATVSTCPHRYNSRESTSTRTASRCTGTICWRSGRPRRHSTKMSAKSLARTAQRCPPPRA